MNKQGNTIMIQQLCKTRSIRRVIPIGMIWLLPGILAPHLIMQPKVLLEPEHLVLEIGHPVHDPRVIIHNLLRLRHNLHIVHLLRIRQQRERGDHGGGVIPRPFQQIQSLEISFVFLVSTQAFVENALDDGHDDEVGDQGDVHVVGETGPTQHGFHGVTRHHGMMEDAPRETVRHLVRENASDALRVRTDGKGNFFVIRDLALLLQILEVVEQTRVHDDDGAHGRVGVDFVVVDNQDLHLAHVVLALRREVHARLLDAVHDGGNERNSLIL